MQTAAYSAPSSGEKNDCKILDYRRKNVTKIASNEIYKYNSWGAVFSKSIKKLTIYDNIVNKKES